ncbi:MAG TPA: hypothetical protein VD907_06420 [Verrucomicrobiae bacterium]|nr:hypothetical protein [Verrucomicrobiae bacterium]
MRVSIVPAQITTVEDKIVGNLSVQQSALIGIPTLLSFLLAVSFPPSGQVVGYKLVIAGIALGTGCLLAIRIRDRIIAQWLLLLVRYLSRPRYYVYDKNSLYLRSNKLLLVAPEQPNPNTVSSTTLKLQEKTLGEKERVRLESLAHSTDAHLKFVVGRKEE